MGEITYSASLTGIGAAQLEGFFVGWPSPPTPDTHLRLLAGSHRIVLALDTGRVVGFVSAVSDGVLSAYIPLLEVLPSHKGRGIGAELVRRMLAELGDLYMVDLLCDDDVAPFYDRIDGLSRAGGFISRNYANQSGAPASTAD